MPNTISAKMQYGAIEGVGKPVSRLICGGATAPMLAGENCDAMLDAAFEAGVTTFDTARVYENSERVLGRWLKARGVRAQVTLLTKGAHHDIETGRPCVTPEDIERDLHTSLEMLGTGHVEIYLLHRDDPAAPLGPIMQVLHRLRGEGLIGAVGVSNWRHARIAEANDYAKKHGLTPFTVSSPHYSLAVQQSDIWGGGVSITGPGETAARAWYAECQMPVVAYSPLGRGLFSGKASGGAGAPTGMDELGLEGYTGGENLERLRRAEKLAAEKGCTVPQLALAWLFCQPFPVFPVLGTTNPARFAQSAKALAVSLSPGECRWLSLED